MLLIILLIIIILLALLYFFRKQLSRKCGYSLPYRWANYEILLRHADSLLHESNRPVEARRIYESIIRNTPINYYNVVANERIENMNENPQEAAPREFTRIFITDDDYMTDETITEIFPHFTEAVQRNNFIRDDNQNVHDSSVQNHLAISIANLKAKVKNKLPISNLYDTVMRKTDITPEKKTRALESINYIIQNDNYISRHDMHAPDALSLVWSYISEKPQEERNNLLSSLITSLEDMKDKDGNYVCSTGIFTRIFGSLDGLDSQVDLRPEWAIKQEMLNKAAVLRKDFTGSDFNNFLIDRFKKDYSGLISDKLIEAEVKSWAL